MFDSIHAYQEELTHIRRHLHMHPELSFQETKTYQFILNYLKALPHINIREHVGEKGIVATLTNGNGQNIALRADFDALPIQDEKDVPYKSTVDGVMHACGHDAHTATLLVTAKHLAHHIEQVKGTVTFIFQFAEEIAPGGANFMVQDGAIENVDKVYGNHYWATYEVGTVKSINGPLLASPDMFDITIYGAGGHGAKPHLTKDAIVIMAEFINQLQTIVARNVNPVDHAVVTVGKVESGDAFNVIADHAKCSGTVRTYTSEVKYLIKERIEQELKGLAISKGITYDLDYTLGFPAVVNHEQEYEVIKRAAKRAGLKYEDSKPLMIGEDFSYYILDKPGAFFLTAAGSSDYPPHHHPMFDINETSMVNGLKMFFSILMEEGVFINDTN